MVVRVAGAQIPVSEVRSNEEALHRAIDRAAELKAEILLTPEGSLSGYGYPLDFEPAAVEAALARVTAHAREVGLGLALGTCFVEDDGRCYNQLRFYERDGTYLGYHAKILLCGTEEDPSRGETEYFSSRELRTFQFGGLTVAGLICNDMWATPGFTPHADPYLLQRAAGLGAQLVFHAVHVESVPGRRWDVLRQFHEANLRIRAATSRVPVVTVDQAAPPPLRCSSPGGVVLPDGEWLVRAPWEGEHVFVADVDVSAPAPPEEDFLGMTVSHLVAR